MSARKTIGAAIAAVAIFVAVKVAPIAVGWVAGHEGVKLLTHRGMGTADVEQVFAKSGMTFYTILKDNFPEDYNALVEKIVAASKDSHSQQEAERLGYEATTAIRHKYASSLLTAPDSNLHDILTSQIEMLNAVRRRETPAVCASFANQGALALVGRMSSYEAAANEAASSMLLGIAAGMKTPDPVGNVTDDDWVVIGRRFIASGATDRDIKIISEQLRTDPKYCDVVISFMDAIQAENSDAGHRVRASMAYSMASQ